MKLKTKVKSGGGSKYAPDKAKIEAARKKLGDLNKRGEGKGEGGGMYIDLVEDKNVARVLPMTWAISDNFFVEVKTHFRVGPNNETCLCPTMHGKKCPLCRLADKTFAEAKKLPRNDKKRDRLWNEAKGYLPRTQYAMVAISVYPEKDLETPKVLKVGPKIFKDVLKFYTDTEEYGPIFDLQEGRDLVIVKTVKDKKDPLSTEYTVQLRTQEKSIQVDESIMDKVASEGPDLDALYGEDAMPAYAKIEAMLEGIEYEDEDEDAESKSDDDEEDDKTKKKSSSKKSASEDDDEEEEAEEEEESDEAEEEESGDGEEDEDEEAEEEEEDEEQSSKKISMRERLKDKAKKK